MSTFMRRYSKTLLWCALFAVAFVAMPALAANSSDTTVFGTITNKLLAVFNHIRNIVFVVGGFGLIGLGFAAIFGKVKWVWLAALAAGLAIVALAGALVDYVTQDGSETAVGWEGQGSSWEDSLSGGIGGN